MSEQQYRMLEKAKGDVLQEWDEMLDDGGWIAVRPYYFGDRVMLDGVFRRPVAQEQKPTISVISEIADNGLRYTGDTGPVVPRIPFRNRNAAIDELVRKVFGAEPVYDDSLSQKEIMKALVEEDIAHRDMTSNHQKFVDPHGVFVEPKLEIPDGLPPLPPVPEGYDRWVYRGMGWESGRHAVYGCAATNDEDWGENDPWWTTPSKPSGVSTTHYIEAVKDNTPPPPANPTRDEILQNLDRIINQGADSDVRSGHYPDALWLEEARHMIFRLEQDRRQLHSKLWFTPVHSSTPRCVTETVLKSIEL